MGAFRPKMIKLVPVHASELTVEKYSTWHDGFKGSVPLRKSREITEWDDPVSC
jgi:hypothetical protein